MSKERKGLMYEVVEIVVKSVLAVGILGIIGGLINWERISKLKKVIFPKN